MNVVIDGLYLTLVGLSVVFVVLILLMLSIYFLNFFEDKFFSNDNKLVPKEVTGVKNSITKDIAAAVAVALYNKSKIKQHNDSEYLVKDSSWITVNRSRIFLKRSARKKL